MSAVSRVARPANWLLRRRSLGEKAKVLGLLVSVAMIGALVLAARSVVPGSAAQGEVRFYKAPQMPINVSASGTLPVFVMRDDRSTVRNGVAEPQPQGIIRIEFFRDTPPEFAAATEALLFEPGLTVLWAAAQDRSQQELLTRTRAVQDEVGRSLERVMASSAFNREYRPVLRAILTDAVAAAWEDERAKAALDNMLRAAEPIMRDMLRTEAGTILQQRLSVAVWDFLKANWTGPIEIMLGGELDYAPLTDALVEAFHDPRFQESIVGMGTRLLEAHESRILAERLAIGIIDRLLRDGRVPEVAARLFWDPRFQDAVRPLADDLFALAGAIPRHLGGLGREHALNPLAAHVFKALTLNTQTNLIMFVTPTDRARIENSDTEGVVVLQPAAPG